MMVNFAFWFFFFFFSNVNNDDDDNNNKKGARALKLSGQLIICAFLCFENLSPSTAEISRFIMNSSIGCFVCQALVLLLVFRAQWPKKCFHAAEVKEGSH